MEAAGDVNAAARRDRNHHLGNREATEFVTAPGVTEAMLADSAQLSSLARQTPEGTIDCGVGRKSMDCADVK